MQENKFAFQRSLSVQFLCLLILLVSCVGLYRNSVHFILVPSTVKLFKSFVQGVEHVKFFVF